MYLTGKVVKKNNAPLSGAVVKLNGLNFSDSTDSSGSYCIKLLKDSVSTGFSHALSTGAYTDTLIVVKNDQSFFRQVISAWIDTLPVVQVAEITVSGTFGTSAPPLLKTEAVVTLRDTSTVSDTRTIVLPYSPATHAFRGFVYLADKNIGPFYTLIVNAYGLDSILNGRSSTIVISSQNDTVVVPYFNPRNVFPVCKTTAVQKIFVNDTFHLVGAASDSFGVIVKWEWDVGGTGKYIDVTPDSGYTGIAPSQSRKSFPCILRVTNNYGATASDTVFIPLEANPVSVTASALKTTVSINDTIKLLGSASDSFGRIISWEWDAGNMGNFIATTPDSNYNTLAPDSAIAAYPCVLRVTDNHGNTGLSTIVISVVKDKPMPTASAIKTMVSVNDTIKLRGTAADPLGKIVSWEWDAGNTGNFVATTPDSSFTAIAPAMATASYPCVLRVTDNHGASALSTVIISIVKVNPVPTASAVKSTVSVKDTIRLRGTAFDSLGAIVSWEWDVGNTGNFVATTPDSNCTAIAPATAAASYPCVLRVTDIHGNVAVSTVVISVVTSNPVPTASAVKTTVSTNDPIRLRGTAFDSLGKIVSWEWDAGNTGNFVATTPDSNFTAIAPSMAIASYPCILRVTDNYGTTALSSVAITVVSAPPVPKASSATPTVFTGDTIRLLGTAFDAYGKIVSWEWDAGNMGNFVATTPDSNYLAFAPDTVTSAYPCVLRVTDDNGISVKDTTFITVVQDTTVSIVALEALQNGTSSIIRQKKRLQ
jgi:hypothetical protein